jgi:hypothetical protein
MPSPTSHGSRAGNDGTELTSTFAACAPSVGRSAKSRPDKGINVKNYRTKVMSEEQLDKDHESAG